ncbi:MAG TPA: N(4)-(beta-N-acetylglucosaminyl)-L-asparaginase [Longimicrobiales bacterium]|nr:N(4)-(beta-N-acetylglucosaminyl)-L-asparaginase [Longimicrobiales bacterium]
MSDALNRRDFVKTTALAGAGLAVPGIAHGAPAVIRSRRARPVVIASANGHRSRGSDGRTCVQTAFEQMTSGTDVLDALIAGVNIVELDPADTSVGYGGLPNADGVVQLDSCCMHGPRKQAGGVAALEGVRTPSLVAHAVSQLTDHHLIAGAGAQTLARQLGFTIEDDLNTPRSRELWLEWKRRIDPSRWIPGGGEQAEESLRVGLEMVRDGLIDPEHFYGTINCDGVNANGDVCGVTTTSGLAWKIPGRVGDSPILGAGLYVDNEVGAAGSTGRGEANLYNLCSFLIVEEMRRGRSPLDAGLEACRRIQKSTVARLQNARGLPAFGINFYVLNARGEHAGVSMYPGASYAVCDENGPRTAQCTALLEGRASGAS